MKHRICGRLATVVWISFIVAGSQALAQSGHAIADLEVDWSDASNPNGAWQYREGTIDLVHFPAWFMAGGQPAWVGGNNTQGNFLPVGSKQPRV